MAGDVFWVGEWRVEPGLNEVRLEGAAGESVLRLEPKVMDLLVFLAREAGEVVTRERLLAEVWDGLHVTEDALNRVISRLRKVFEDDPVAPRFIETIRQRGYRLVAPVRFGEVRRHPAVPRRRGWSLRVLAAGVLVAAAAGGLVGRYLLGSSGTAYRAGGPRLSEPVPLTSLPGEERDPALSPDGESLAFLWNGGDGLPSDLYLKPTGSEEVRRLSDDGSFHGSPVWSPDGLRIALVRHSGRREVVVLDLDRGDPPRPLARVGDAVDVHLDWSPDGRRLVLTDRPEKATAAGLYLLDVATGRRSPLVTAEPEGSSPRYPVFLPDGDVVVFARTYSGAADEICSVPAAGGGVEVLLEVAGSLEGLDVAPGGGLLYAVSRGRAGELWWWHPEEGASRLLTSPDRFFDLRVTSRGEVLFARWAFDANVWRLDLRETGGAVEEGPVLNSSRWDSSPAVSTKGDLAFVSLRSGTLELWRARPDGSGAVRLTSFEGASLGLPSWSPDGRRIAIRADLQVYVLAARDGEGSLTPVTRGPARHAAPSWSRDGRRLYFVSNEGDDWSVRRMSFADGDAVEGGDAERLTDGTSVRESVGGADVYFTRWKQPGLWRRSLASAPCRGPACRGPVEERLVDDLDPGDRHNWTLDERGVYYVASTKGGREIVFLDLATRRKTRLGDATLTPYDGGLAASPDGDSLLFVRVDRSESDLMMARLVPKP